MALLILGDRPHGAQDVEFVGGPLDGTVVSVPVETTRIFYALLEFDGVTHWTHQLGDHRFTLHFDNRSGEDEPHPWYAERHNGRYLRWTEDAARWHPYG